MGLSNPSKKEKAMTTIDEQFEKAIGAAVMSRAIRDGDVAEEYLNEINFRAYLKLAEAARRCKPGYVVPELAEALAELDGDSKTPTLENRLNNLGGFE